MDVDWAESQVPSAALRGGKRVPGTSARLTRAQAARIELLGTDQGPADAADIATVSESEGLCSGEACVRARSEVREPTVVRVDLDVDALSAALAQALVTALDGRVLATSASVPVAHAPGVPTPKRSFWAGAWHADVVLSSIAILVVVVVLLAWTV